MADEFAEVIVKTTHGNIKGRTNISIYNDSYVSYEKVPYAQPPLGDLRFLAPQPLQPWHDVTLDCTQKSPLALQGNQLTNEIIGSEDCLYLNIYIKALNTEKPLPVLVFIHGGGFEKGDPTRDFHAPDYLMMKDVILVTIGYRLGALGFLSFNDPSFNIPGNAGLKDIVMALQWLKLNLSNFNGDAENVTIYGNSAGSAAAHYLLLSPIAQNLFQKAILMSGSALCPWSQSLKNLPLRLALRLGYNDDQKDSVKILEFLRQTNPKDLIQSNLLTKEEILDGNIYAFGPVIEPYESANAVILEGPEKLITKAWSNKIPLLIGGTSFEGLIMYTRAKSAPMLLSVLNQIPQVMLPREILRLERDLKTQQSLVERIKLMDFGDKLIGPDSLLDYCEHISYKMFWLGSYRTIKARLKYASAPTYVYRFDVDSPDFNFHRNKYCGKGVPGVSHADDLSYLFYSNHTYKAGKDSSEYKSIVRSINVLTAFVENSNPGLTEPVSNIDDIKCINIDIDKTEVIDLPEMRKLKIWDSLYKEYSIEI